MRNSIILLLASLFICSIASAEGDGGYAGAFLRGGIGARPLGMGGAFTAIAEGADAAYYNPAGLGYLQNINISMSYKSLALDRHLGYLSVSLPIRNEAAMGISWINSGVSDLMSRGESRQPLGEIKNNQNAFALTFSKAINPKISFGVNLRYVAEKYDNIDAFTIGVGGGVLFKAHKMVTLGALIDNLGSNYRWETSSYWSDGGSYDENFPVVFRFGAAGKLLSGALIPAIDFEKNTKQALKYRIGSEYWFIKKVIKHVEDEYEEGTYIDIEETIRYAGLRAGLNNGTPSLGGTYNHYVKNVLVGIEYAFVLGNEGTSAGHLFSLNVSF